MSLALYHFAAKFDTLKKGKRQHGEDRLIAHRQRLLAGEFHRDTCRFEKTGTLPSARLTLTDLP
jgi:hypothetical protein